MNGGEDLKQAIRDTGGRPALAAFLTGGFPEMHGFEALLATVGAEADVVEIGVPFTDPMADGVTIQESSRRALESGVTLKWILDTVQHAECKSPIVLMSYLNPVIAMGLQRFAERSAEVGVAGLIVPDLPLEECEPIKAALDDAGVALIQLVTPVTPPDRLATLCGISQGFVYAVTVTGTTGGDVGQKQVMLDYLDRVRAVSAVPVLAGFGIREAAQVSAVAPHADGVIVGSALIEVLQRGEDPIAFLRGLRDTSKVEAES
ncbi:MAG: tryptophan synthase subunit alpha [Gemmatimonadetes bacterium]|nr:tryptophan synthase subunit alpha [Gemmatimonadota bacterium]